MKLDDCIEEFLTYIFSVRSLSQNTVDAYREDYKHLKVVQKENIEDFDINDFRFCIGVMSKAKYSVTSINRFMAATRTLFAYAKKFGYIQKNPGLELKSLRIPKYLPKFMTQSEIDNLCKEPDNAKMLWPARDKAIFEMLYSSGCRVSELASICFSDFAGDFSSVVVTGKGKKDRKVYFEKDARDALAAYLKERKERFPQCEKDGGTPVPNIFINQKGTALSVHGIWYIVTSYSGPGGTNHQVSPHSFRHTFATQMLNSGADIRAVQEMLGHASISTTQRYTHVTTERLKEIYKHAFPHK